MLSSPTSHTRELIICPTSRYGVLVFFSNLSLPQNNSASHRRTLVVLNLGVCSVQLVSKLFIVEGYYLAPPKGRGYGGYLTPPKRGHVELLIYLSNGTRHRDVIVLLNTWVCIAGQVLWHWTCRP